MNQFFCVFLELFFLLLYIEFAIFTLQLFVFFNFTTLFIFFFIIVYRILMQLGQFQATSNALLKKSFDNTNFNEMNSVVTWTANILVPNIPNLYYYSRRS